jgi:hypothetical protein
MTRFYISLGLIIFMFGQIFCNDFKNRDTTKTNFAITYQPILNISADQLLLQYLAINVEMFRPRSEISYDLQSIYTYINAKTNQDFYRSVEHFSFFEFEIGRRYYFGAKKHEKKRKVENKSIVSANSINDNQNRKFYFKPAIGLGISHYFKDEIDLNENIHRMTTKVNAIPTIGFYLGMFANFPDSAVVLNPYFGAKLGTDSNVIFISPLISIGIGAQF